MNKKEENLKSLQAMLDLENYAIKFDISMRDNYDKQIDDRRKKILALEEAIHKINNE